MQNGSSSLSPETTHSSKTHAYFVGNTQTVTVPSLSVTGNAIVQGEVIARHGTPEECGLLGAGTVLFTEGQTSVVVAVANMTPTGKVLVSLNEIPSFAVGSFYAVPGLGLVDFGIQNPPGPGQNMAVTYLILSYA